MPSRKVSELEHATQASANDVLYIVVDTAGTPTGKQITIEDLLKNLPGNTVVQQLHVAGTATTGNVVSENVTTENAYIINLDVQSDGLIIRNKLTPSNSTGDGISSGKIFFDDEYLYIKTANSVVKRVSLELF